MDDDRGPWGYTRNGFEVRYVVRARGVLEDCAEGSGSFGAFHQAKERALHAFLGLLRQKQHVHHMYIREGYSKKPVWTLGAKGGMRHNWDKGTLACSCSRHYYEYRPYSQINLRHAYFCPLALIEVSHIVSKREEARLLVLASISCGGLLKRWSELSHGAGVNELLQAVSAVLHYHNEHFPARSITAINNYQPPKEL